MTMAHALCPHRNSKGANSIYLLLWSLPVTNIFDAASLRTVHRTHNLTFKAILLRTEFDDTPMVRFGIRAMKQWRGAYLYTYRVWHIQGNADVTELDETQSHIEYEISVLIDIWTFRPSLRRSRGKRVSNLGDKASVERSSETNSKSSSNPIWNTIATSFKAG